MTTTDLPATKMLHRPAEAVVVLTSLHRITISTTEQLAITITS